MQIRNAVSDDIDELIPFYIRMNEVINSRTEYYNPDNPVFPSEEAVRQATARSEQLVGIEDGRIVAAAIVNHECSEEYFKAKWQVDAKPEEFWVIHAMRVLPEYEGRGFATQILSYLIGLAPCRGQKAIRLDVLEDYPVQRLYLKFGFRCVDTVEILYEDIGYPKRFRLYEKVI